MKLIQRAEYLNQLKAFRDKSIIKVISGIRRCGKSTLFQLYQTYLTEQGVSPSQIIHINFEDLENETYLDYRTLYRHVLSLVQDEYMYYVFFDEVQHVDQFEKVIDSLHLKTNIDVHITGSNAYFMSGELATLLSGRTIEIKMLPLSFKEYCSAQPKDEPLQDIYNRYVTQSSFPYTLALNNDTQAIKTYLEGIFHTIILKDVVTRYRIEDVKMLESVVRYVFSHIGSRISVGKIANAMTSSGRRIDNKTVEKYIRGLLESLICYEAKRYNIKGKQLLKLEEKYYVSDLGLRHLLVGGKNMDIGHILENVIFLELIRRGYDVKVGKIDTQEVDFVATTASETLYIQVAASVRDLSTLQRELSSLQHIKDNYPKLLLTLDNDPDATYNGIQRLYALNWLRTS